MENVFRCSKLSSPEDLLSSLPNTEVIGFVSKSRETIKNILSGKDKRKIIIVGPCSIHNFEEGITFAKKLSFLAEEVKEKLFIIMRTYLEKPRSSIGWKGIVYDFQLSGNEDLEKGIFISRKFLLEINKIGVPCSMEFVNPRISNYLSDLVSWGAIGARTVESQPHREFVSALSMPVGIKNSPYGEISSAVNACLSASHSHAFIGISIKGEFCQIKTIGNSFCHVVLRGGKVPNYFSENVLETLSLLSKLGLPQRLIIDCSHGNSGKVAEKQEEISYHILEQMKTNFAIKGIMLESNLCYGSQPFPKNFDEIKNLKYGVSITDSCIDFKTTERIIRRFAKEL